MRKVILLWSALGLAVLVAPGRAEPPPNSEELIAAKRAHLATVVDELARRDVSALSPAQRQRRRAALATLARYAERGVFPHNTKDRRFAIPYFIDDYGTRCALAHVVDRAGDGALVEELARTDNHAWVAHLRRHEGLLAWLARHGLTLNEAAFIQAPGIIDDPGDEDEPAPEPEPLPVPEPHDADPGTTTPPPTPAPASRRGRRARSRATVDRGSWERWWRYNRDAFVPLRERYHAAAVTTGPVTRPVRARRPSTVVRDRTLVPFLARMADEEKIQATALMAWTMAAPRGSTDAAVAGTLAYLREPESRYRDLMLLALGLAHDRDAVTVLRALLLDAPEGRRALRRRGSVPARTRAFAAIALGEAGDPAALDDLLTVARHRRERPDVAACAVTAVGLLLPVADADTRNRAVALLVDDLVRERGDRAVRAAIPAALVRSGDPVARDSLVRIVARFRGDDTVRASCALALGQSTDVLEPALGNALLAAARRDPDLQTRRFATIALGELCARDTSDAPDEKLVQRLERFYLGTLAGKFKVRGTKEWHLLSAGLFARRFAAFSNDIAARLVAVATRHGSRSERAAAALALGLSGNPRARAPLAKLLRRAKDAMLRGATAESLGLLGETSVRDDLRRLALEDSSGAVRYQAALGLGYLADASVVEPLVAELGRTGSAPARAALTRVLGQLGDRRAIAGLMEIAQDGRKSRAVRERALGALGLIGREDDAAWTLRFRRGTNFAAATPTLRTILGIF